MSGSVFKTIRILWFLYILPVALQAQDTAIRPSYKSMHEFGAVGSAGSREVLTALQWNHLHGFGHKKQRFKIGYGLRFSRYAGTDKNYITAPARLTSGETGPQVFFIENKPAAIDTVFFSSAQVNMLNASIHLQYTVLPNLDAGFNIDAIGFSFGGKKTGQLISDIDHPNLSGAQVASPTVFNLLLVSDNDRGSLNSEFYLRYWFHKCWALKAGYTFLFTEYTTANKLIFDNDRFRYKSSMVMLGVSFRPFQ